MQAQNAVSPTDIELSSDSHGWQWRVSRPGRPPLQGRTPGCDSARRTGRFAVEMLQAFDRISRKGF